MNKQQLAQKIWASANQMRSKIEANEYKDYILGFIFYKYLSDKEIKFLKENDYDDELLKTVSEADDEMVKWVQENIGYFISYKDLFSTWLSMGKDFDVSNVRDALSAFSRLISSTHKKVFDKVFDTLQTGLSKLGDSSGSQTKAISGLLSLIKDIPMDGKQDYDVLGFIYEYLISNFAANAGKKAGEFYTPHEVSLLMSEIVASHLKGKSEIKIYDPTSGSGSLLINIGQCVAKYMTDDNNIKYKRIEREPEKQLDLLIVVDQMLTGFDSKWVNTLYMDKILEYENIIQAFSRTNRLFGPDKPFGIIRYYRKPHTMEQNVSKAVKLYSGDRPIGLFVEKLSYNLDKLNSVFDDIACLFKNAGVPDFEKLPADGTVKAKFASMFRDFNGYLEAAKIQGFKWDKHTYSAKDEESGKSIEISMKFDENVFLILAQRYKELSSSAPDDPRSQDMDIPYDLVGYLTEIDTGVIDANYMNSRFDKYLKLIRQGDSSEKSITLAKAELHKTFATLTQEEQKYANIFLHDIERGDVIAEDGKTLRDYITEYQFRAKDDQIHRFATIFGLDEDKLRNMMGLNLNEASINEFGRFDELKKSVDKSKAKAFFEAYEQVKLIPPKVNMKTDRLLRKFILSGGFEISMP